MYARAVDHAESRLRELRHVEVEDLGMAALSLALAIGATQALPALALPLFVGGLVVGSLGLRALWTRWDIVDRLASEPEAYVIPEVRRYAVSQATMERRRAMACSIRSRLRQPAGVFAERLAATRAELEALARELEDEALALDPPAAIACSRLLTDPDSSPLFNPALSEQDLRARILRVRSGLTPL